MGTMWQQWGILGAPWTMEPHELPMGRPRHPMEPHMGRPCGPAGQPASRPDRTADRHRDSVKNFDTDCRQGTPPPHSEPQNQIIGAPSQTWSKYKNSRCPLTGALGSNPLGPKTLGSRPLGPWPLALGFQPLGSGWPFGPPWVPRACLGTRWHLGHIR